MPDYVTLIGTEEVRCAASTIQSAADTMARAAGSMDDTLHRSLLRLEELVFRIEAAVEKLPGGAGEEE